MNRHEYDALRRAAYEAAREYSREANSDGRSSYGSHSIRCLHALRDAQAAEARVPRNRANQRELDFNTRMATRRGEVKQTVRARNAWRKAHGPLWPGDQQPILQSKQRDIRRVLRPIGVLTCAN